MPKNLAAIKVLETAGGRLAWQCASALILASTLLLGGFHQPPLFASEKLTPENVAPLLPQLFKLHLSQHEMSPEFIKRVLKEFLTQLDPVHRFYLKSEADEIVNKSDDELRKIGERAMNADLSTFHTILDNYLTIQIARDAQRYDNLAKREDEIKKEADRRETGKKVAGGKPTPDAPLHENPSKLEPVKEAEKLHPEGSATASDDEEEDMDKIKWMERPATDEERDTRILKSAAAMYRLNKSYLSEKEAIKLSLQMISEERNRWLKVNVDVETPKTFLKAFLAAMDPHTVYFDDEEDGIAQNLKRSFFGIGVQIRQCPLGAQVEEIIVGGPTEKSGKFAIGDQIIDVDGTSLAGMTINKVVRYIKGEKDTEVKLTVLKLESKKTEVITLKREEIQLADMRVKGKKFETPAGVIGFVSVQNFYQGVHKDVKDRILELSKDKALAGMVLDLRFNQGGYLEEAVGLAGLFIKSGPIVGERSGAGVIDWKYDFDNFAFTVPLVILTSQFSASASEIVAGSLKDYNRAIIVGPTQTFGKGTVQRVIPLINMNLPGEIKITTHQYFIAGGDSTQLRGVTPDVTIPGSKLAEDMLEKASENAVPFNKIAGRIDQKNEDFKRWGEWKTKNVAMLQEKSKKRMDSNQDYKDFFDLKKRKIKFDAEKAEELKRKPDEAPVARKKKDEKDPQADEAVAICADMAATWGSDKTAANKTTSEDH